MFILIFIHYFKRTTLIEDDEEENSQIIIPSISLDEGMEEDISGTKTSSKPLKLEMYPLNAVSTVFLVLLVKYF